MPASLPHPVHTFFTPGSPLSQDIVRQRLGLDGVRPTVVLRWVNINAVGDPIGGSLSGWAKPLDREFLGVPAEGCVAGDMHCAHASYFRPRNLAVVHDIFGSLINTPLPRASSLAPTIFSRFWGMLLFWK